MVDSVFASLENIPQRYFVEGVIPGRIGNRYEFVYPYDSFRALDGWVIIGVANDRIWRRFVEATGLKNLAEDERFKTNPDRVEHHEELKREIESWTSKRRVQEIVELLNGYGVPAAPIYTVKDIVEDEHIAEAREMVIPLNQPGLGRVNLLGSPIKMSETRPRPRGPAPRLGGDTEWVLREILGLSLEEISQLREMEAI